MTDLRTRIAEAASNFLSDQFYAYLEHDQALELADAVIRELKLQPETKHTPGGAILTRLDGKVLADTRYQHRWVTPWENDERPVK